jgi:uncharacterized OB-fold protein
MSDARPDNRIIRCPGCGAWCYKPDSVCLRCGTSLHPND